MGWGNTARRKCELKAKITGLSMVICFAAPEVPSHASSYFGSHGNPRGIESRCCINLYFTEKTDKRYIPQCQSLMNIVGAH